VAAVQGDLRKFFESMGAHLGPRESVFYNDRDGTLLVCATLENAKIIRDATEVLNQPAPNINIAAKFAEVSSNKDLALNTPSVPNAYARTNLIWASSGRQLIDDKLNRLRLDPITYEGLPLSEVLINLNEQAKKHDPEKRGVNIIINPNLPKASLPPGQVDPSTGLPITAIVGAADLGAVSVKTNLNLQDLSLRQALDAIVAASDKPIKYSIEDYAVVFSAAGTKADWQDPKVPVKPVTPPLIPQPEVQTRENAFSTFSLNVSDVAFKLAGASLEKGQMPESASIRSEEFINAFDYRDPEAPAGVPVAFAWERARYPYAQNRDLLRFSIKTAAQGRQAGRPLNLVLLMDNSGSMERADRIAIIREALKVLASQLQPQDKLSVITFARTAQLRVDGVPGSQASQVAEDIGGLTPEGGTNIEEAMNLAYQTALRHYLANGINRVVLLTDGAANLGNVEPESLKQKVEVNRKQGVALDCFGIGWEGFNDDLLETLSRNGDGRYGFINSPEEAATEFAGQLAGALNVAASDVKVQVEFNPNRVTAYRQIGYAKHQLTKEQFRDNTVDAAEIAAQEAGNALYVIEVNPAGQGPVATVRVRFKVPDTSDYREHEWSVPFNGNAVALEQASPAMRLAATASAFSEWLASSPFATEVTPDTLLSYLSGVPEVYGADARPKKLEWMIRQAKSLAGGENRGSNVETRNKPEESKPKDANRVQFP
jgi:Mg-chelatase subunit ChlD